MSEFFTRLVVLPLALLLGGGALANDAHKPWLRHDSSIVLDAYEYTLLDWEKLKNNERLAGFINKASDGLPPTPTCGRDTHCRLKWRRYVAAKELYHTRKTLAKTIGLKWGAYHLARPGNPIEQAQHFLRFTRPQDDELLALDIEHNDPSRWMSLKDAETFARYVKKRTGRYPVLYTNHDTAKFIARNRETYQLLSKLNLWYARYKPDIRNVFPMGHWQSYTLWQFSSMANCNKRTCLRRIAGADNFIDVNVVAMSPAQFRRAWPFAALNSEFVSAPGKSEPAPVAAKGSGFSKEMVEAIVRAFAPVVSEPESVQAFTSVFLAGDSSSVENGSSKMAVEGYVPVPRWPRQYRTFKKTIVAKPAEIGIHYPLVSLARGPIRPLAGNGAGTKNAVGVLQVPHALDRLAEPRTAMVAAKAPDQVDGVIKLFPTEAVMLDKADSVTPAIEVF